MFSFQAWIIGTVVSAVMGSLVEHVIPTLNDITLLYVNDAQRVMMCQSASIAAHFMVDCAASERRQSMWGIVYYPAHYVAALWGKWRWGGPSLASFLPMELVYLGLALAILPSMVRLFQSYRPQRRRLRILERQVAL